MPPVSSLIPPSWFSLLVFLFRTLTPDKKPTDDTRAEGRYDEGSDHHPCLIFHLRATSNQMPIANTTAIKTTVKVSL